MQFLTENSFIGNPLYLSTRAETGYEVIPFFAKAGAWCATLPPEVWRKQGYTGPLPVYTGSLYQAHILFFKFPFTSFGIGFGRYEPTSLEALIGQEFLTQTTYEKFFQERMKDNERCRVNLAEAKAIPENHQILFVVTKKGHGKVIIMDISGGRGEETPQEDEVGILRPAYTY